MNRRNPNGPRGFKNPRRPRTTEPVPDSVFRTRNLMKAFADFFLGKDALAVDESPEREVESRKAEWRARRIAERRRWRKEGRRSHRRRRSQLQLALAPAHKKAPDYKPTLAERRAGFKRTPHAVAVRVAAMTTRQKRKHFAKLDREARQKGAA